VECWKPDWKQATKRLEAWWHQEVIDRVCIYVTARRNEPWDTEHILVPPEPDAMEKRWTDLDYRVAATAEAMRSTYFGGEALPVFNPNLGPDLFACYFGAEPIFNNPTTTWVRPIIDDWDRVPTFRINEDNRWWKLQLEFMRRAKEASAGRWLVGCPDTHSNLDCLAALRGQANLAMDFHDQPERVKAASEDVLVACLYTYDEYYKLLEPEHYGSVGWLQACWGPGRTNVIQCDYLAFVSPRIAEEFIMPSLAVEARAFDHCVYHLDGPEALPSLDLLLEIPEIQAIQWVQGDGHSSMPQWIPLIRRIQKAGKSVVCGAWPHEIQMLMEELNPEGLLLITHVSSELEARVLIEQIGKWTRRC
jgi:hypothetical protein